MSKSIYYSNHAVQRRFERGISENQIEQAINHPDYTKTSFDGRKIAVKKIDGKIISVIYVEKETYIRVITVY